MPLSPATLADGILSITDRSRPGHTFPADRQAVADRWSAAVRAYFEEFTPTPAVTPPSIAAACEAGESAMRTSLLGGAGTFADLPIAVQAFGVAFALVLTPAVALPPPAPFTPPALAPALEPVGPANALAAQIDTWARSGLQGIPPTAPGVPWA